MKGKIKKYLTNINYVNTLILIILFPLYIFFYYNIENNIFTKLEPIKYILCWVGIIMYIYILFSWYKKTGKIIDIYTIMMSFFVLFNYGQCFLWALNIHRTREFGSVSLYGLGVPSSRDIVLAQLITLSSIWLFHLCACLYKKKKKILDEKKDEINRTCIFNVSRILSILVIPAVFIQIYIDLKTSSQYGYSALYYGEHTQSNLILELLIRLFFPCLFGLIIGSNYKKSVKIVVYVILALYSVLSLMCGDRGNWLYGVVIFIVLHYTYYKKLKWKTFLKLVIIGFLALNIIYAIVSVRNSGINYESVKESLDLKNNVIVSAVAEMGSSMGVQTALVKEGYNLYPYGNTYLFSILGVISDKAIRVLGFEYVDLSTWFSKEFLELKNWGAGFTIVGEALINSNPYIAPIIVGILGYIITSLTYFDKKDFEKNSLRVMFALITYISLIPIFRGILSYNLKVYVFRLIILGICFIFYREVLYKRRGRRAL